jgi:hypothetical protein
MAYLATVLGMGILQTIPSSQRTAVLTPKGIRRRGDGWSEYAPGLWVSNTHWMPSPTKTADEPFWSKGKDEKRGGKKHPNGGGKLVMTKSGIAIPAAAAAAATDEAAELFAWAKSRQQ